MTTIETGRMTHAYDGELVVFLIGALFTGTGTPRKGH